MLKGHLRSLNWHNAILYNIFKRGKVERAYFHIFSSYFLKEYPIWRGSWASFLGIFSPKCVFGCQEKSPQFLYYIHTWYISGFEVCYSAIKWRNKIISNIVRKWVFATVERIILKGHLKLSTSVAQMNDTPLIVDIVFLNKQLKNEIK